MKKNACDTKTERCFWVGALRFLVGLEDELDDE